MLSSSGFINPNVLVRSFITGAGLISALSKVRAQILNLLFSDCHFFRATFKLLHGEVLSSKVDILSYLSYFCYFWELATVRKHWFMVAVLLSFQPSSCFSLHIKTETKPSFSGVKFVREQRGCLTAH